MGCSRCGQSRNQRPTPPPSISGNQVPRPGSKPSSGIPSTPVGNAISGLKYVPGK
jgi:hypothetical protein